MNYTDNETADELRACEQEQIDAVDGWNLDTTLEIAMDALRCPPLPDAGRCRPSSRAASAAASPCAGCYCASPICSYSTSRPITSTPSRWRGSSSTCSDYRGTVVAITHWTA